MTSTPSFTFFSSYLLVFPLLVGFLFQEVSWCSHVLPTFFMVGLLRAMDVCTEPSLIALSLVPVVLVLSEMMCKPSLVGGHTPWSLSTLPVTGHPPLVGSCCLSSLRDEVHTVP